MRPYMRVAVNMVGTGGHLDKELLSTALVGQGFGNHLGGMLEEVRDDYARAVMPFRVELVTFGDTVHGGAIAGLLDLTATAAAWSTVEDPAKARGTTIGFSVNYLDAARGADVVAEAKVIRRGRSLVYIEVDIACAGKQVAKGLVSYKLDISA